MKNKAELFQEALNYYDFNTIEALLPELDLDTINHAINSVSHHTILNLSVSTNSSEKKQLQDRIFNALMARGANVNRHRYANFSPLMLAIIHDNNNAIQQLLDAGANLETQDEFGRTALFFSAGFIIEPDLPTVGGFNFNPDAMKLLLTAGANNNPVLNSGRNLIDILEQRGDKPEALYILKNFGTFQYRLNEVEFNENNLDAEDMEIYTSCRDPITLEIINDPIAVSSGITYDRKSLQDWVSSKNNPETIPCPVTKLPIQRDELNNRTHIITKGMINRFVLKQETEFGHRLQLDAITAPARASEAGIFSSSQNATSIPSLAVDNSKANPSVGK